MFVLFVGRPSCLKNAAWSIYAQIQARACAECTRLVGGSSHALLLKLVHENEDLVGVLVKTTVLDC